MVALPESERTPLEDEQTRRLREITSRQTLTEDEKAQELGHWGPATAERTVYPQNPMISNASRHMDVAAPRQLTEEELARSIELWGFRPASQHPDVAYLTPTVTRRDLEAVDMVITMDLLRERGVERTLGNVLSELTEVNWNEGVEAYILQQPAGDFIIRRINTIRSPQSTLPRFEVQISEVRHENRQFTLRLNQEYAMGTAFASVPDQDEPMVVNGITTAPLD